MQFINDMRQKAGEAIAENASTLLTAGGVVGTVTTAVLAGRGGYKFNEVLRAADTDAMEAWNADETDNRHFTEVGVDFKTKAKLAAIWFGPPTLTCTATVTSIIMANRMSAQKAAALAAAYGLAERNLSEYKAKVAEKITGPKREAINEELAKEQVDRTPGHNTIIIADGNVLCFDRSGGRYFNGNMQSIQKAVNTTNQEIHNHGYATASFFYTEIGLPATQWSDDVGFNLDNPIDLDFSTVLTSDDKPCLAFEFKTAPKNDYHPKYT